MLLSPTENPRSFVNPLTTTRPTVRITTSSLVDDVSSGWSSLYSSNTFSRSWKKVLNTVSFAFLFISFRLLFFTGSPLPMPTGETAPIGSSKPACACTRHHVDSCSRAPSEKRLIDILKMMTDLEGLTLATASKKIRIAGPRDPYPWRGRGSDRRERPESSVFQLRPRRHLRAADEERHHATGSGGGLPAEWTVSQPTKSVSTAPTSAGKRGWG